MNILKLVWRNICFKPLSGVFSVLLLAMGMATILTLGHLNTQLENRFTKDLQGIDLVVSGKGSPLQIILSSVFHVDIPTGNIPLAAAEELQKNKFIKQAIPLALGDNYNGYRIVGTNTDYINHYGGTLAQGQLFIQPMQAVVGSQVATQYNNKLQDKIVGAHGLSNSDDLHTDFPYTIVGILKPTGTVLDRLVLTPVASVWQVHAHPDGDDPEEVAYKHAHPEKELTALLISYRTPLAAMQLPRLINKNSALQAASPAFEVARLMNIMGVGSDILTAFGALLVGFAVFGFFVTLYNALHERRYDLAVMRALGATKQKICSLIIAEVLLLAVAGSVLGVLLAHMFLTLTATWIMATKHMFLVPAPLFGKTELVACGTALLLSLLAAIVPSIKAYKLNIVKTLTHG